MKKILANVFLALHTHRYFNYHHKIIFILNLTETFNLLKTFRITSSLWYESIWSWRFLSVLNDFPHSLHLMAIDSITSWVSMCISRAASVESFLPHFSHWKIIFLESAWSENFYLITFNSLVMGWRNMKIELLLWLELFRAQLEFLTIKYFYTFSV